MSRYTKIEVKEKSKFPELLQENDLILDKSTFLVYRWFMTEEVFREIYGDYEEIQTAEVKPIVYGEWKRNNVSLVYKCSVCENARITFPYPYCPMCGAEMMNSAKW